MTTQPTHENAMSESEIVTMTRELLDLHEVVNFRVKTSGRMTRMLGLCDFGKREIRISRELARINDRSVTEDVIRHEVAHAIAGPGAGHGPQWKDACRVTGATPKACVSASEIVTVKRDYRWKATCDACGEQVGTRRKAPSPDAYYSHVRAHCSAGGGRVSWTDSHA